MSVSRCAGIEAYGGYLVGDGYEGKTRELDCAVQKEAEFLQNTYGVDVEIRFNHNRESGGAWLKDGENNANLGMGARQYTKESHEQLTRLWEKEKSPQMKEWYGNLIQENRDKIGQITFEVIADTGKTENDLDGNEKFRWWDFDTFEGAAAFIVRHFKGLKSE